MKKFKRKVLAMLMTNNFGSSLRQQLLDGAPFCSELLYTAIPQRAASGTTATFTRATTATWPNNDGHMVTGVAGEIGFVGARRVRNLLTFTEDFSNAAWSITGITRTATTITETATGTDHSIRYIVASGKNIWQIKVKPNGRTRCALASTGSTNKSAIFNLTTGAVEGALTDAFTTLGDNPTITLQSDGYYLITMGNLSGTSTLVDLYMLDETSTARSYAGDITKGMFLKQAQLEDVTAQTTQTAGEYVSVGVESAPYYHGSFVDGVKCFPTDLAGNPLTTMLGYSAEGARTNRCLQSQTFDNASWTLYANSSITANQAVAPDGTTTADLLHPTITAAPVGIYQQITLAAATATTSVYAKAAGFSWFRIVGDSGSSATGVWFNLASGNVGTATSGYVGTIEDAGNGWYRCSVAHPSQANPYFELRLADADNSNNATASGTNGIYLWGAQIESAVSFASSYIATTTVAVTRNADVLTYSSAGNIDGTKGWCYAEASAQWSAATGVYNILVGIDTANRGPLLAIDNAPTAIYIADGTNAVQATGASTTFNSTSKRASTWGGSTMSVTGSGAAVASGAFDGNMNVGANISVGILDNGGSAWFGTIRNVRIGQRQLSASELGAITS